MNETISNNAIGHNAVRIEVVTSYEQLLHAYAVRSICFMEETGLAASQTFDGNDYQATHLIIYSGDEPVGALRIRWFHGFARIERTGFRQAYRSAAILRQTAAFAFEHIARKGYAQVYTHAKPVYARLWRKVLGFKETGREPMLFKGHEEPYIELVRELDMPDNAITLDTDPNILFRVEGLWDAPSLHEAGS
jgi:hypothetical protein